MAKMIYEAGLLKELDVHRVLTLSSQGQWDVCVWLTLAGCLVHHCPLEQMLPLPVLSISSPIILVVGIVLTAGSRAGESKSQGI